MAGAHHIASTFMVLSGLAEDEDIGTYGTYTELKANQVKEMLQPWCSGKTSKRDMEFIMMSPVSTMMKGEPVQYYLYVHDFARPKDHKKHKDEDEEGNEFAKGGILGGVPSNKDSDELFTAIVHATTLMSQNGKVWTKKVWDQVSNSTSDGYPTLNKFGYRNPVFCAFRHNSKIYGFTLVEENGESQYNTFNKKYKPKGVAKNRNKARERMVIMTTGQFAQAFRTNTVTGLDPMRFTSNGVREWHNLANVTVAALKKIVTDCGESFEYDD